MKVHEKRQRVAEELFGDNPEAMRIISKHLEDTYEEYEDAARKDNLEISILAILLLILYFVWC